MFTKSRIEQLIKDGESILREEQIHLEMKTIEIEYTKKIGVLIGLNLQFAAKPMHENEMCTRLRYNIKVVAEKKIMHVKETISQRLF